MPNARCESNFEEVTVTRIVAWTGTVYGRHGHTYCKSCHIPSDTSRFDPMHGFSLDEADRCDRCGELLSECSVETETKLLPVEVFGGVRIF